MARRAALIKKTKPKAEKLGRKAIAAMNVGAYGAEPAINTPKPWKIDHAINWYSCACDDKTAKDFLLEYFEFNDLDEDYKIFSKIDDRIIYGYGSTACWIARMMSNGFNFDETWMDRFRRYLERIVERNQYLNDQKKVETSKPKDPTPGQKLRLEYHISAMNAAIDAVNMTNPRSANNNFDLYDTLRSTNVHSTYVRELAVELTETLQDIEKGLDGSDEEVAFQFDRLGYAPVFLKKKKDIVLKMLNDVGAYMSDNSNVRVNPVRPTEEGVPKERRPRKKKVLSPDKLISRVKYQVEDTELKLKSIDPKKILGAQELWLYNTKYAQLQVYRASGPSGLSIKGTTILDYDEKTSLSKRVGRHAEFHTGEVLTAGKVALRKYMDTIHSTIVKVNGRIGENTIILRVVA